MEEEAKGEAQWAVVQEKLEQDREVRINVCLPKTGILDHRLVRDNGSV